MITSDLAIDSQNMDPVNDKTEQSRFKRIKIANTVQKGRWSCTDSVLVKSKHKNLTLFPDLTVNLLSSYMLSSWSCTYFWKYFVTLEFSQVLLIKQSWNYFVSYFTFWVHRTADFLPYFILFRLFKWGRYTIKQRNSCNI